MIRKIQDLDEYLQVRREVDRLSTSSESQRLHLLIERMSDYEEENPEEIRKVDGDDTTIPPYDSTFEEAFTQTGFDDFSDFPEY